MHKTVFLVPRSARAGFKSRPRLSTLILSRTFTGSPPRPDTPPNSKKDRHAPSPQDGRDSSQGGRPPKPPSIERILADTNPRDNTLLAPVHIAEDANSILKSDHPAADILSQSGIVVQRELEMWTAAVGFKQANQYVILDPHGNHIGYMAEHHGGVGTKITRQLFATRRAFTTRVFDRHSREVLRFERPFSWLNSRIRVFDSWDPVSNSAVPPSTSPNTSPNSGPAAPPQISQLPLDVMCIIGEAHSQWVPLRRRYNLFLSHDLALNEPGLDAMSTRSPEDVSSLQRQQLSRNTTSTSRPSFTQFATVNEPFLSWDFSLLDQNSRLIGSVNRSFRGWTRELLTDTGSYALQMDSAGLGEGGKHAHGKTLDVRGARDEKYGMTLDQRAVMLATAVSIDYDYFSRFNGDRHWWPGFWFYGGGGEAAGGAAGAGAAGAGEAGGAVIGGAGRAVGSAAGGAAGAGEGAIAGAGTMAGYEAMQRGMGRGSQPPTDDASPQQPLDQPHGSQSPQSGSDGPNHGGDVWGPGESDPWKAGESGAGAGGGSEGGGFFSQLWDAIFGP